MHTIFLNIRLKGSYFLLFCNLFIHYKRMLTFFLKAIENQTYLWSQITHQVCLTSSSHQDLLIYRHNVWILRKHQQHVEVMRACRVGHWWPTNRNLKWMCWIIFYIVNGEYEWWYPMIAQPLDTQSSHKIFNQSDLQSNFSDISLINRSPTFMFQ